jgi:hypothetical protein
MARFAGGRAGNGITGIAGVSWAHQTAHRCRRIAPIDDALKFKCWRSEGTPLRDLARGFGEIVLQLAGEPASIIAVGSALIYIVLFN